MAQWPLKEKLNTYVDKIGGVAITRAVNALRDDALNWRRFPGLVSHVTFPIPGMVYPYWMETSGVGVAVCAGDLYRIDGTTATEVGHVGYGVPSFVDFGARLLVAAGGKIYSWTPATNTFAAIADADAPQEVVSLVSMDLYVIALDSAGIVWHSEVNEPDTWLGEFFKAESQPDKAVKMAVGWEELTVFGTETVQGFYNSGDADGPIQAIQGSTVERGCIAPHSVAKIDQAFFFLDNERKVQRMSGRTLQIVSEPVAGEFQAIETVSDAYGFPLTCNGETLYCLVFPTEGKGWAFDYKRQDWTEIGSFENGEYVAPVIQSAAYFKGINTHVAGTADGRLLKVSTEYNDDAGTVNRFEVRFRMNHGTEKRKACLKVRIRCKRGLGTGTEPVLMLSYRDNGKAVWSNEKRLSLALAEHDPEFYAVIRRLGQYREREWRLVVSDAVPVLIVSGEEDVEVVE